MPRVKREVKSKEDVKRILEVKRNQALVKDKIYPALVNATVSIQEAKALNSAISGLIMEEAMRTLQNAKMVDIRERMVKVLCEEGRKEEIGKLLDTLEDETLYNARTLIEGLNAVIDQALLDENTNRTLNSLEFDWNRMMQL